MLTAILLKVGLPFAGILIGWIAKKWHIEPYVNALETKLQVNGIQVPGDEKTPVDRPTGK